MSQGKWHQRAQSSQEENSTQPRAHCWCPSCQKDRGGFGGNRPGSQVWLLGRISPRLTGVWPFSCHEREPSVGPRVLIPAFDHRGRVKWRMTDAVTIELVKLKLIIYVCENNSYGALSTWCSWGGAEGMRGLSVWGELSVSRQQNLQTWKPGSLVEVQDFANPSVPVVSIFQNRNSCQNGEHRHRRCLELRRWNAEGDGKGGERGGCNGASNNGKKSRNLNFRLCSQWPWANCVSTV